MPTLPSRSPSSSSALVALAALLPAVVAGMACGDSGSGGGATPSLEDGGAGDVDSGEETPPSQPSYTIGEGLRPGVTVDASGTAYVAWHGPEPTVTSLKLCRLARGGTACEQSTTIAAPGTSLSRPFVFVDGDKVSVVSHRYGLTDGSFEAVYLFESSDRGASFDAGRPIATLAFNDATIGPGAALSFTTDSHSGGLVFEHAALDAPQPSTARAVLSTDQPYGGTVALVDPSTPLVAFADGEDNAWFRKYAGTGDLNDATNWSPAQPVGPRKYRTMDLVASTTGVFLKSGNEGKLEVHKFDGASFGARVELPDGLGEIPQSHLSADPAGRLHVVWPRIAADGVRLYYAMSDDGAQWTTARLITSPDFISTMRVAAAADHRGVAVWSGPASTIRFTEIAPPGDGS